MKNDNVYIWDMVQAARKIQRYLDGRAQEDLENDDMLFDAVVREFQVMGQAAIKLSDNVKRQYKNVPWRNIVDMRNFVVHEYSAIEIPLLWSTAKEDVPVALKALEALFHTIEKDIQSNS